MKRPWFRRGAAIRCVAYGTIGLAGAGVLAAMPQPQGESYRMTRHVIAGGGGSVVSTGDQFKLTATIGQAETGALVGGPYRLQSGFWRSFPGDSNGDGFVDVLDLLLVINKWGSCPEPCPPSCAGDLTGDCEVDVIDLLTVIHNWS